MEFLHSVQENRSKKTLVFKISKPVDKKILALFATRFKFQNNQFARLT